MRYDGSGPGAGGTRGRQGGSDRGNLSLHRTSLEVWDLGPTGTFVLIPVGQGRGRQATDKQQPTRKVVPNLRVRLQRRTDAEQMAGRRDR